MCGKYTSEGGDQCFEYGDGQEVPGEERLSSLGFDPVGNTAAEFASQMRLGTEKWGKVIRAANIKVG